MSVLTVNLEIDADLFHWFEEYCEDGLLELDEELAAVATNFIETQIDEADEPIEPLDIEEEEVDIYDEYREDLEEDI